MTYYEVIDIGEAYILPIVIKKYCMEGYKIQPIQSHKGGRNVIYTCEKENAPSRILRISYQNDRSGEDYLAELEFVRYLHDNGASVANVIHSRDGKLLEEMEYNNQTLFISLFEKAKGMMLVDNNYCYRAGVPLTEYFYNCGKTLGKIHQVSKEYQPVHQRYHFSDKFNMQYINNLLPVSLTILKKKISKILDELENINKKNDVYGMIHFDYSDGNYHIDFNNGQITVYDFDNCCFAWYMYDLAELWIHGTGWVMFEEDVQKRKQFMEDYFAEVLKGYKSETTVEDSVLELLPLFIQANLIENIVDAFEVEQNTGENDLDEEELEYLSKCLLEDIPYKGFFHDIYSCSEPFVYKE